METIAKIEAFYNREHPYKEGISILRELTKQTDLKEDYKWSIPVYTINNKNVLGICVFKEYFGVWFFDGSFLKDKKKVLVNAQEGKTKAMRHWKFTSNKIISKKDVLDYMLEATENRKKGITLQPAKASIIKIPLLLKEALTIDKNLKKAFDKLTPYKQREYYEYIDTAKQEKTKTVRLEKIIPLITKGVGLNDAYRK